MHYLAAHSTDEYLTPCTMRAMSHSPDAMYQTPCRPTTNPTVSPLHVLIHCMILAYFTYGYGELSRGSHHALAHFTSHRYGPSSIPGLGRGHMCEKFHQFLTVGRWFPPGTGYSGFLHQKTDFIIIIIISLPSYDPGVRFTSPCRVLTAGLSLTLNLTTNSTIPVSQPLSCVSLSCANLSSSLTSQISQWSSSIETTSSDKSVNRKL